jgi:ABC-type cobalamin transport system ATPase subunit
MYKSLPKAQEDEKDRKIEKLCNLNFKLVKQLHDLNYMIQKTIEHGEQTAIRASP